ncbi:nucleotidyltransferase family protein [Nitrospinae bacterium AH_259_B05_G02_I21]|nr:nucleotidyltransferase family protein [Nitrospinae bacterium AH_259_B05_G02_I21]
MLYASGAELLALARPILQQGNRFRMRAPGYSMGRTIRNGELIEVAPCRSADLRPGVIAFYQRGDRHIAHRIIRRLETNGDVTFLLRGDALLGTAEVVPADAILGRVTAVHRGDTWRPLPSLQRWFLIGRLAPWIPDGGWRLIRRMRATPAYRITHELLARGRTATPGASRDHPEEPFDWEEWIDLVLREGLGGLFGYRCQTDEQFAAALPEAVRHRLTQFHYAIAARNLRIFKGVASIIAQLHQAGVDVVVLKGAHLAEAVYPSVGCRPMGDVDLLLRPGDFSKAARVLSEMGYEAFTGPEAEGIPSVGVTLNSSWLRHPDPYRASLHLHWHLRNTSLPYGLVTAVNDERLWTDAQGFDLAGYATQGLAPHHLLLHLADHAVVHRYDRLMLLADMAAVIERYGDSLDWPLLLDEAQSFGLLSSLAMSLLLAARYAAAPVPSEIHVALAGVPLTLPERRLVHRFERHRGSLLWGWLIYGSRCPTWSKRLRYLWLTLRPASTRLTLQAGGATGWRGYVAFCLRRLAGHTRP